MNKLQLLMMFIIGLTYLTSSSFAWSKNNEYNNWLNISITPNWKYIQSYDYGNTSFTYNSNVNYVLVSLNSSITNSQTYNIRGYSTQGLDVGAVNYSIVNSYGGVTRILMPNKTTDGIVWKLATIFYNPISPHKATIEGTLIPIKRIVTQTSPFNPTYKREFNISTGYQIGTRLDYKTSKFVVLASSDLSYENMSISFTPEVFSRFYILPANSFYILKSEGILTSANVISESLNSDNARNLFNQLVLPNTTPNYEGFFDLGGLQAFSLRTENMSMSSSTGNLTNSTTSIKYTNGFYWDSGFNELKVKIYTNSSLEIDVLPAFTNNYTLGSIGTNLDAHSPLTSFKYYIPITNITWVYNYTTKALTSHLGTNQIISYGAGRVGFAIINLTKRADMGLYCDHIYIVDENVSRGSIPYYVDNCTTSKVSLVIPNTTSFNYTNINSIRVYYGAYTGVSSSVVYNDWILGSGSKFNVTYTNNVPYLVTLNLPLNLNSKIYPLNEVYFSYGSNYYLDAIGGGKRVNSTSNIDYLVCNTGATSPCYVSGGIGAEYINILSYTLGITCDSTYCNLRNTTTSKQYSYITNYNNYIRLNLSSPITAVVHKLATSKYVIHTPIIVNITGGLGNSTMPNTPEGFNFSTTGFVTLPNLNFTTMITIYPNVQLSRGVLIVISLIFIVLISFSMVYGEIYIAIIGFIGLWLLILRTLEPSILFPVIVVTALFVIKEYVMPKKEGKIYE